MLLSVLMTGHGHSQYVAAKINNIAVDYRALEDGEINKHLFGDVLNQTVLIKHGTRPGLATTVNVVEAQGRQVKYSATHERFVKPKNKDAELQFVSGFRGERAPFNKEMEISPGKLRTNELAMDFDDISFTVGAKNPKVKGAKARITGYLVTDTKTKKLFQPEKMWIYVTNPLTNKTEKKELKWEGTFDQARAIIIWDLPTRALVPCVIDINTSMITAPDAEEKAYAIKYSGSSIPPVDLIAISHYWASFVLPAGE